MPTNKTIERAVETGFMEIPGYIIKTSEITGFSIVEESKAEAKNTDTGKREMIPVWKFSIFWSFHEAVLVYQDKEEADKAIKEIVETYFTIKNLQEQQPNGKSQFFN